MRPVIGIVSLYDESKESYWMLPGYVEGIEEAGGGAVILPLTTDEEALKRYAEMCDGFLFPGGQDLDPAMYGEEMKTTCGELCRMRDEIERKFFPIALATGKPMLGICRGIQLFNVMQGGTLYQDIPEEFQSYVNHHETPPYHKPAHKVTVSEGNPLCDAVGAVTMDVNSYHHQGIKELGKGLEVAAASPDGLPEAVYFPHRKFALAVQWHPEFSHKTDENSRKIFKTFIDECTF